MMPSILTRFWADDSGVTAAAELILITTLLGIALVTGLQTIRDAVIQELGDAAVALESLDQSYSFTVGTTTSVFEDETTLEDPPGDAPACIAVGVPPTGGG